MPVLTQEQRIAAEETVRTQLGLPMMGVNSAGAVATETLQVEREILGVQFYGFGEVWSRPGLDMRTRCFITLSVLATKGQHAALADYVRASLKVGITASDVLEAILHVGVYAGITAASEGLDVARDVFLSLGLASTGDIEITPAFPMDRQDRCDGVSRILRDVGLGRKGLAPESPPFSHLRNGVWGEKARDLEVENDFNQINGEYGYGEIWARPALGYRIRSFITLASLQAQFANDQLHFHLNNAVNLGITGNEIHEALGHAGIYCGGANWRNAANVARDIFLQRGVVSEAAEADIASSDP